MITTMTRHIPVDMQWRDLGELHRRHLLGEKAAFTMKADGYLARISFSAKGMTINTAFGSTLEPMVLPSVWPNGCPRDALVLEGELIHDYSLWLFDANIGGSYAKRHAALQAIVEAIDERNRLSIRFDFMVKAYSSSLDIAAIRDDRCPEDGVIVYSREDVYRVKPFVTLDLWYNAIDSRLHTEDGVFVGYARAAAYNIDRTKLHQIVQVTKFAEEMVGSVDFARADRSTANTAASIRSKTRIPYALLHWDHSRQLLRRRFRIGPGTLLHYEYELFKSDLLRRALGKRARRKTWLDLGCGRGSDLYHAVEASRRPRRIIACDCDPDAVRLAKTRAAQIEQIEGIPPIRIHQLDVTSAEAYAQIAAASIDVCTVFLSVKSFTPAFFRNLHRWLRPHARLVVLFFEDVLIPESGIYCTHSKFGMRIHSATELEVYRARVGRWVREPRLNSKSLCETFADNDFKLLTISSPTTWFRRENAVAGMMLAATFTRAVTRPSRLARLDSALTANIDTYLTNREIAQLRNALRPARSAHKPENPPAIEKRSFSDDEDDGYDSY